MAIVDARTWMEHLGTATCWALLDSTPVGRIGVRIVPTEVTGRRLHEPSADPEPGYL